MRFITNGLLLLVVFGLVLALLRAFDWDVFAVLTWAYDIVFFVVDSIADFFSNNQTFNEVVKSPKTT